MGLLILNLSFCFNLILKLFLLGVLLIFSYSAFLASHPIKIAIFLIATCSLVRVFILKISYSWMFFLLVLIFLGGVIIIIIYMTSLASNEKNLRINFLSTPILILAGAATPFIDSRFSAKSSSSFEFVKVLYELEFFFSLILCFFFLLTALIRIVKLIKLEEGPLVKRLLKPNLKKNIHLSSVKYLDGDFNLHKVCFENK